MKSQSVFLFGFARYLRWTKPLKVASIKADAYDLGGSGILTNVGASKNEVQGAVVRVPECFMEALMMASGFAKDSWELVETRAIGGQTVQVPVLKTPPKTADLPLIQSWPAKAGVDFWGAM